MRHRGDRPKRSAAYGVFDVEPVPGADKDVLKVNGMVEKPKPEDAPSLYAAAGRYVLDRAIFDALRPHSSAASAARCS